MGLSIASEAGGVADRRLPSRRFFGDVSCLRRVMLEMADSFLSQARSLMLSLTVAHGTGRNIWFPTGRDCPLNPWWVACRKPFLAAS